MNFNMITLKDVKNFVKKFPEIELINEYDFYWTTLWIDRDYAEITIQSNVIASLDYDKIDFNKYTFTYGSSIEQLIDFYDDQMFEVKKSIFKQKEYSIIKRKSEMNKDFV